MQRANKGKRKGRGHGNRSKGQGATIFNVRKYTGEKQITGILLLLLWASGRPILMPFCPPYMLCVLSCLAFSPFLHWSCIECFHQHGCLHYGPAKGCFPPTQFPPFTPLPYIPWLRSTPCHCSFVCYVYRLMCSALA